MKFLLSTFKKYKLLIVTYLIIGLVQTFLQSFSSSYFQKIIDNFSDNKLTIVNIIIYGVVMISLYIINYLVEYPGRKLQHGISLSLKINALQKVSVIDYLSFIKIGTGTLIQRIENGASAGTNILFGFYLRLGSELIPAILFNVFFIFIINKSVTIVILLGYIVVFIITNLLLKALYKVKANILINEELFNHFLVRGFMELVVFRVNRRFEYEVNKAKTASNEIINSKVKMTLIHEAFFTIFAILVGFVKIGVIIFGWTTKSLSIGEIVALITLVDNAYMPIAIFNVLYVQYKLDKVAFERYVEFLDAKEDKQINEGIDICDIKGNIILTEVDFSYNSHNIFNNLSLNIPPGEKVAFVGESGSGKSTAVKLIVGLLHPQSGKISVDDFDLAQLKLNSYYKHIAYLPQEPPVFDGTLRENLVFDDKVDDDVLLNAINEVKLDSLFSKLDKGFDTQLGERGISLSGGERQQLALARLWFSNAHVVIFDEATSAIDNLTEEVVMRNVMKLLSGRTVIAIAHRLDTIKSFDNIIVFQKGCIVEQGKFDNLIKRQRYFNELYNRSSTAKLVSLSEKL